jgi:predicted ArsR family transcriptional regulator
MDPEQRRVVVTVLRVEDHSLRSIAGAVGVSDFTVREDLKSVGAMDHAPAEVVGREGKRYPSSRPDPAPAPEPELVALSVEPVAPAPESWNEQADALLQVPANEGSENAAPRDSFGDTRQSAPH